MTQRTRYKSEKKLSELTLEDVIDEMGLDWHSRSCCRRLQRKELVERLENELEEARVSCIVFEKEIINHEPSNV